MPVPHTRHALRNVVRALGGVSSRVTSTPSRLCNAAAPLHVLQQRERDLALWCTPQADCTPTRSAFLSPSLPIHSIHRPPPLPPPSAGLNTIEFAAPAPAPAAATGLSDPAAASAAAARRRSAGGLGLQFWRGMAKKRYRRPDQDDDTPPDRDRLRINREINAKEVRFVDQEGNNNVVPLEVALAHAKKAGLDLVEVSPNATPPVCRLMDYMKERYLKKQKENAKRADQRKREVIKEVRVSNRISSHDLETKVSTIRGFLKKGFRVKISVVGKLSHTGEEAFMIMKHTADMVAEFCKVESPPAKEKGGQKVSMLLQGKGDAPAEGEAVAPQSFTPPSPNDNDDDDDDNDDGDDDDDEAVDSPRTRRK